MITLNEYKEYVDNVIYSIKNILYKKDPLIFDKIDFYNDDIFLEPLLFSAIINNDNENIERSLMSYKSNSLIKIKGKNSIYIPNIGYIKLINEIPIDSYFFIKKTNNILSVTDTYENCIQYKIEPIIYILNDIEFLKENDKLLENLFINKEEEVTHVDFIENKFFENKFKKALKDLEKHSPLFYNQLMLSLKKVIFFKGDSYCFSTIKVHITIFFYVNDNIINELFFIEHLLHEGGHIIFNNITFDSKNELFIFDYKTLFKDIEGFEKEHGDLYSRFHGIFTHYLISSNFHNFLKKDVYKGDCDRIKELEGRFCFDMNKYKISLELFSKDILSEKGYELYNIFLAKYHEIINSNSNLINKYNLDNQTYMFSFEKFCQSNLY